MDKHCLITKLHQTTTPLLLLKISDENETKKIQQFHKVYLDSSLQQGVHQHNP